MAVIKVDLFVRSEVKVEAMAFEHMLRSQQFLAMLRYEGHRLHLDDDSLGLITFEKEVRGVEGSVPQFQLERLRLYRAHGRAQHCDPYETQLKQAFVLDLSALEPRAANVTHAPMG
jgi:hypothetical protein